MRTSRILAKLQRDEPVLLTTLRLASPVVFELASLLGIDGLWLDLEHHSHSLETATNLIRAARVGTSEVLARPAKGEFMRLARLLEAGAQGIIYPRCESAAEARELVRAAKFPPLGQRGADCGNPDAPYNMMAMKDYLTMANEQTFVLAMVEDEASVARSEEILAVPGITGLFLGSGDFTSFGGFPGQMDHPKLIAAIEHIATVARRVGKPWGLPVSSADEAARYLALGARIFNHSSDQLMLKQSFEQMKSRFAATGIG